MKAVARTMLIFLIFISAGISFADCFYAGTMDCDYDCKVWVEHDDSQCKYVLRNCYNECWPDLAEGCIDKCTSEDWKAYQDYLDCMFPPPKLDEDCVANCTAQNKANEEEYQKCLAQNPSANDPDDLPDCTGTECCKYEKYKDTPSCIASSMPDCTGLECCQYEEYKNTTLCKLPPTPEDTTCSKYSPVCPIGTSPTGVSVPYLINPNIASESKCRGACGPNCPSTCADLPDEQCYIPDSTGKCYYVCTYNNVIQCGTHDGCQEHDDCYDNCAANGETGLCWQINLPVLDILSFPLYWVHPCHCDCDQACIRKYGLSNCFDWMNGKGNMPQQVTYSTPPLQSGPFKTVPIVRKC
jgi:hypothetical protein